MGKMKAIVKEQPGLGAVWREVPIPEVGHEDILVKVEAASICGSDVHIYNWDPWSQQRVKPPMIMGHEFSGQVVEIGQAVRGIKIGDFVSAETHIVCGHCYQCRTGSSHVCQDMKILGVDRDGAFAEYIAIPAVNAVPTSRSVPPEVAAIQEPLGNAVHTVLAGEVAGRRVAVFGCGPVGALAVGVAKAAGATAVYAIDINDYRLELAKKMGANLTLNPQRDDVVTTLRELAVDRGGVDVFLEMSGSPQAVQQGLAALRNGGRASILGVYSRPVEIDWTNDIVFKGVQLQGITGRRMFETWYTAEALLSSGALDVTPLITHRLAMEDYETGFEAMRTGNTGKVVLFPRGSR
ncbi:MAG: L-threonine 3-dehydrogenase [Firmicutes bacterium]|nr:L-threonine 3-dehydrogenase [Bacillota bacterium]